MSTRSQLLGTLLLGALVGMPVAAYVFVFAPRNEEIASARAEIRNKEARLASLRQLNSQIGDLGREIEDRQVELAKLNERLPDQEGLDGLLKELTRIAQRTGVSVRTVKGDKPLSAGAAMEIPLNLTVEGDFGGYYEFLLAVEGLPRITRVQSMRITRLGSDPHRKSKPTHAAPGEIRAELTLSIYFNASAASASAAAAATGGSK
ncbi:MAG: type 4a pilus biogenesis protein PilO [Phycisphaera sp.]|nr:type 4a pilus biogenesis protein PilO [Phycisphaera sp.]